MVPVNVFDSAVPRVSDWLERVAELNRCYHAGEMHAYVPDELRDSAPALEDLVAQVRALDMDVVRDAVAAAEAQPTA